MLFCWKTQKSPRISKVSSWAKRYFNGEMRGNTKPFFSFLFDVFDCMIIDQRDLCAFTKKSKEKILVVQWMCQDKEVRKVTVWKKKIFKSQEISALHKNRRGLIRFIF